MNGILTGNNMRQYFTEQLSTAIPYSERDLVEDLDSRREIYGKDAFDNYKQRQYNRIGVKKLYMLVKDPNEPNPLCSGTLMPVYENDLWKYENCLQYVDKTTNSIFPIFTITDMDAFNQIKKS